MEDNKTCISCGNFISKESNFCQYCGNSQETYILCKNCGYKTSINAKFCQKCGKERSIESQSNSQSREKFDYQIPNDILSSIPMSLKIALIRATPEKQSLFVTEYENESKSKAMAYFLWFWGFHYAYVSKWGIFLAYFISWIFLVGILWGIIDLFRINSMINRYNETCAIQIAGKLGII